MKIGIITQPIKENFGGILQNYALQSILKNMGHKVVTIDCVPEIPFWLYLLVSFKTIYYRFILKRNRPFQPYRYRRSNFVQKFIDNNICVTERCQHYSKRLINKYKLDALIVGSDQVWRPSYNKSTFKDMFLSFCGEIELRKIAYAASFGVDSWEYTQNQTKNAQMLIKKFDAISVREKSGEYLCYKYLGVHVKTVLDPTLLLSKSSYLKLIPQELVLLEDYLLVYILDNVDSKKAYIESIAEQLNCKVIYCFANDNISCSVEQWLAYFYGARWIITDSFHGTVFSIIFNKQFVTINNNTRGSARFIDLLQSFELRERMVDVLDTDVILKPIDWHRVNKSISTKQEQSIQFIRESLKS